MAIIRFKKFSTSAKAHYLSNNPIYSQWNILKITFPKFSASFSHPSISTETTTPGDNKESMQTSSIISDLKDRSNSALNDLFL